MDSGQAKRPERLALNLREASEALGGVSPGLLLLEAERGHLRVIRIGKGILVPASEVRRLVEAAPSVSSER